MSCLCLFSTSQPYVQMLCLYGLSGLSNDASLDLLTIVCVPLKPSETADASHGQCFICNDSLSLSLLRYLTYLLSTVNTEKSTIITVQLFTSCVTLTSLRLFSYAHQDARLLLFAPRDIRVRDTTEYTRRDESPFPLSFSFFFATFS